MNEDHLKKDTPPALTGTFKQNNKTEDINALKNKLARANRELATLYQVSNAMQSSLELKHVLYIILTGVTSHTGLGFNRAILFLVNDKDRCLEPKMAIGPESGEHAKLIWKYIDTEKQHLHDLIKEEKINQNTEQLSFFDSIKQNKFPLDHKDESLLNKVLHSGEPIHIQRNQINAYQNDPLLKFFDTKELIIMPLKAKDIVNGLIVADNIYTQKSISDEDLNMFTMLANQAGFAIDNSQLYEMVRHKSHTDSLTNLWNHGFFQSQCSTEIDKANKNKTTLSLLILDIDNFKNLNDSHGHQNGDIVLKEIAQIIRDSSRNIDFACRYGGEEFSVILTQSNQEQAWAVAERIRKRIEEFAFPQFNLYKEIKVTISIGLATHKEGAKKEDLIAQADKAMYHAKFNGKNQICIFDNIK